MNLHVENITNTDAEIRAHVTLTNGFQMQNILHFKLYLHYASSYLVITETNNLLSLFIVMIVVVVDLVQHFNKAYYYSIKIHLHISNTIL